MATFKFYGGCLTPNCECTQFDGLLSGPLETLCGSCGHGKFVHLPQEVVTVNPASANCNNIYGRQHSSGFIGNVGVSSGLATTSDLDHESPRVGSISNGVVDEMTYVGVGSGRHATNSHPMSGLRQSNEQSGWSSSMSSDRNLEGAVSERRNVKHPINSPHGRITPGTVFGGGGRASPGAHQGTTSQSNRSVNQMFGRFSNFSPGHEGNALSRGNSNGMNFGSKSSSRNSSPSVQATTVSRVLSVYILPFPKASGNNASIPTAVSRMKKLMDHHGAVLHLQNANGSYPSWDIVDERVREVLNKRKEEAALLGEDGLVLSKLFEGPFYVARHSHNASEKGKILLPRENDPSFPSVNLSYLTLNEFGFRIPGHDKISEYCLVLLHKDWEDTFSSGMDDTRKNMDTMWDVCKHLTRTLVAGQLMCTANCMHFQFANDTDPSQQGKRQRTRSRYTGNDNSDEDDDIDLSNNTKEPKCHDQSYSVFSMPIPAEVPKDFNHVSLLQDAKQVRATLFLCLTGGGSTVDFGDHELSAKAYKRDVVAKHGVFPWTADHVPILLVNLGEISEIELAKELSCQLSLPESTFPHSLAQSVVIHDMSSNAVDSGGLYAFTANNLTNVTFNKSLGKREIPLFFGKEKVFPNPKIPISVLITQEIEKELFGFGRVLATAWFNGTTVLALKGPLHECIYHYLTNDEKTFLEEQPHHYSFEYWKALELQPQQFKAMYTHFRLVMKSSIVEIFEFFELDICTFESCTTLTFELNPEAYVKYMRRQLWLSIFASESFLYMSRALKKGWNVESACDYLQRRDFEYLFVSSCAIPLDAILYTMHVSDTCDSVCSPDCPAFSMLKNLIYALTLMKPEHLSDFVTFLYGAPSLPILSQQMQHKWTLAYVHNENRLIPSSTCNHHLVVNLDPEFGQVTLPLLCENLQISILHGQHFGPP